MTGSFFQAAEVFLSVTGHSYILLHKRDVFSYDSVVLQRLYNKSNKRRVM